MNIPAILRLVIDTVPKFRNRHDLIHFEKTQSPWRLGGDLTVTPMDCSICLKRPFGVLRPK